MAPKVVDVDPDGTDSESDSKPSESQIPSAPALDESKSSQVASTPPTVNIQQDTPDNIQQVASAHEVSSPAPMLTNTEPSKKYKCFIR